jgi:putative ABC transport system permease protein
VIKDFHHRSLHEQINPLLVFENNRFFRFLTLNVRNEHLPSTLSAIEKRWKTLCPESAFSATFLDDALDRQYKGESNFGRLFLYFSVLAIFISCLGLFGLALFSTLQRAKEIGIRKVIGAGIFNLLVLVIKDFLVPVAVSLLIAFPVAGYVMNRWLDDFAYRIHLQWCLWPPEQAPC